jgi:Flp pilus assembly pilin Flp
MMFSEMMLDFIRANWRKEEGQTMAEYGVVLAVITVLIVGTLATLSKGIRDALGGVTDAL